MGPERAVEIIGKYTTVVIYDPNEVGWRVVPDESGQRYYQFPQPEPNKGVIAHRIVLLPSILACAIEEDIVEFAQTGSVMGLLSRVHEGNLR